MRTSVFIWSLTPSTRNLMSSCPNWYMAGRQRGAPWLVLTSQWQLWRWGGCMTKGKQEDGVEGREAKEGGYIGRCSPPLPLSAPPTLPHRACVRSKMATCQVTVKTFSPLTCAVILFSKQLSPLWELQQQHRHHHCCRRRHPCGAQEANWRAVLSSCGQSPAWPCVSAYAHSRVTGWGHDLSAFVYERQTARACKITYFVQLVVRSAASRSLHAPSKQLFKMPS